MDWRSGRASTTDSPNKANMTMMAKGKNKQKVAMAVGRPRFN
jgi:hypothetical protein